MRRPVLIFLSIGFLLLSASPATAACWAPKEKERKLARMTNRSRTNHDRRALAFNDDLSKASRVHSRRMARRNYLFHNTLSSFEGLLSGTWQVIGENVGVGRGVRQIHRAFLRSTVHRANILRRGWRKFGVGAVRKRGSLWVTVMFSEGGTVRSKVGAPTC